MACRYDYDNKEISISKDDLDEICVAEAILCGIMKVLDISSGMRDAILAKVDWKEAGVSRRELNDWWNKHKKEDEKRINEERSKKEKAKKIQMAIGKLSPEEITLLGLSNVIK